MPGDRHGSGWIASDSGSALEEVVRSGGPLRHARLCGEVAKKVIYDDKKSARAAGTQGEPTKRFQNRIGSRALKKGRDMETADMEVSNNATSREVERMAILRAATEAEIQLAKQLLTEVQKRRRM